MVASMGIHEMTAAEQQHDKNPIDSYREKVISSYLTSVDFPAIYRFVNGEQVLPLPPVETAVGGVFIVGAYPSARFSRMERRIVPVGNLKMPFDPTEYPNGTNASARELDKKILEPLGLTRGQCWITNLVKPFLFKDEHVAHFGVFNSAYSMEPTRKRFEQFGKKSVPWIIEELQFAQPKLILTLGREVAGILLDVNGVKKRNDLLDYKVRDVNLGGVSYRIVHIPHPGILMRRNAKWDALHEKGIISLREEIRKIFGAKVSEEHSPRSTG